MRKTIAFIGYEHLYDGGGTRNTVKLIHLVSRRFDVVLVGLSHAAIIVNCPIQPKATFILKSQKYFNFSEARLLAAFLKENKCEVIFNYENGTLDMCAITKRFFYPKLKFIYQQHNLVGIRKKSFIHTLRYQMIDLWLTPIEYLRTNDVLANINIKPNKVKVVPIGIDTAKFINRVYDKNEAREKMGIPTDITLVGAIGRITPLKGQDIVAKAFDLIPPDKNIGLLLFGSASPATDENNAYYQSILDTIEKSPNRERIFLHPFTPDVHLFYDAVDVVIMPSLSETFGTVVHEAMASQLPVLAASASTTPHQLKNGELGWIYEPKSPQSLVDNLFVLLATYQTETKVKVALEHLLSYIDKSKEIESVTQIFESLS